jgi:hypothetical protein
VTVRESTGARKAVDMIGHQAFMMAIKITPKRMICVSLNA